MKMSESLSKRRFVEEVTTLLEGCGSAQHGTFGFAFSVVRQPGDEWRILVYFSDGDVVAWIGDECCEEHMEVVMRPWPGADPAEFAIAIQNALEPPLPKWGKRRRPKYRSIDARWRVRRVAE
jgi:hypothetical protein